MGEWLKSPDEGYQNILPLAKVQTPGSSCKQKRHRFTQNFPSIVTSPTRRHLSCLEIACPYHTKTGRADNHRNLMRALDSAARNDTKQKHTRADEKLAEGRRDGGFNRDAPARWPPCLAPPASRKKHPTPQMAAHTAAGPVPALRALQKECRQRAPAAHRQCPHGVCRAGAHGEPTGQEAPAKMMRASLAPWR